MFVFLFWNYLIEYWTYSRDISLGKPYYLVHIYSTIYIFKNTIRYSVQRWEYVWAWWPQLIQTQRHLRQRGRWHRSLSSILEWRGHRSGPSSLLHSTPASPVDNTDGRRVTWAYSVTRSLPRCPWRHAFDKPLTSREAGLPHHNRAHLWCIIIVQTPLCTNCNLNLYESVDHAFFECASSAAGRAPANTHYLGQRLWTSLHYPIQLS